MLRTPILTGMDAQSKRQEIRDYFQSCYRRYESLFEVISDENAYYNKADPLRHPLIFYYGHTAVFYINKFKLAKLIDYRVDKHLESIFAIGVDEMSWDDLNEKHYDWPTLQETRQYRDKVFEIVNGVIDRLTLELPITEKSPWWTILMGIEHENIHLETSAVLMRQLPLTWLRQHHSWQASESAGMSPSNSLLEVKGGTVHSGTAIHASLYGWDNEYGEHTCEVPDFKASKYLVSNQEFLEFVEDRGYETSSFWSEEGNAWRSYEKVSAPRFWIAAGDHYKLRTLTKEIPLPLNWPVEVNFHEAEAFCKWKSEKLGVTVTLPTEDEYFRLRDFTQVEPILSWGEKVPGNLALEGAASSTPIDCYEHHGFYDVIGNVWQWSRTPIYPYEGFKVHPIYDDFTVPTFDGEHNLIKGGSWISCGNLATESSRYAFRRHFYQFAGFRYVESMYEEDIKTSAYMSDILISQYCHFGWGENRFGVANYPQTCAKLALEYMRQKSKGRALDVGCAIGRSSFELAREFDEVIGVDFSARFIQQAQLLKEEGVLRYSIPIEGELEWFEEVSLNTYGLEEIAHKVSFWQADACNLKSIYEGFDLIFAGNLIDRLYDPGKFLDSLAARLNEEGMLILTSPYTWMEEYTPKEKWIGGYKKDGNAVTTLDGLMEYLGGDFVLVDTQEIPFVIRETERKHQYTIAQMSIWQKKRK
ncbi:5-histidylcysteine sulfoxide synthase [Sulfurovum sp. zt1-1]|uniref:5-histidylcysteine sulfoxide synthase n=1 Tax=Sulfurovum zhangzhouensis TaxID=3019067 RepID=A0ABT7R108_9BACT|nr:5-histidylcysteine sulfoxide synthase [Sulfurovum zhangzhouensis]MDM5272181.1 5-histidylcysteine sulfoxide synthase [Sulfurovum zhangzhouensis]